MKKSNVVKTEHLQLPTDVAISRCVQNLFATFGEERVRESMGYLFSMKTPVKKQKSKSKAS